MSVVTNNNITSRVAKNVKAVLLANTGTGKTITDPKKVKRDDDQPLYRLNHARRKVYYPHIVIGAYIGSEDTLSLKGDSTRVAVISNITVIADNTKDLDNLVDTINSVMRSKRASFKAYKMDRPKDYNLGISETTRNNNVVQKVLSYRFIYYAMVS